MKKAISVIFILLAVNLLSAETLIGQIHSAENDKALEGVSVYLDGLNKGTMTDGNGNFVIRDLEPGKYTVHISRLGYQSMEKRIEFPAEQILNLSLQRKPTQIEGLRISSTVAIERETPVTFTNMNQQEIAEANYGQDIPMLLNELPNVLSYADAGNPLGYSYLKIRGFDQKRIGVMINGIPLNDPEDHQVYWVDMPDFAESISDIQFQRGVGSSIYGVSTFGGSLNMQTNHATQKEGSELFANYGSYNTAKYGFKTTRDILNYFKLNLRLSGLQSDGYRDNSATEQWSYFFNLSRVGERSISELNLYGGKETTHAAWYASSAEDLQQNHQHNPINYDNEIDQFSQPHYEFHHSYLIAENLNTKNSFFYIRGEGFYEQFKEDRDLWEYGLAEEEDELEADLVRRKWVEKNHFGWIGNLHWQHKMGKMTVGSYISFFDSDHWGEIKELLAPDSLNISFQPGQKYYNYLGEKTYYTAFLNEIFQPLPALSLMLNLHYQKINYKFKQKEAGNFTGEYLNSYQVDYDFFNPRFGVNCNLNEAMNLYANISLAQREPADDELFDIWDGPDDLGVAPLFAQADTIQSGGQIYHIKWSDPYVKPEKLVDYELGFGYDSGNWKVKTNLFWMDFQNEIVGYGAVDEDGNPIRGNAEKTVHRGVEISFDTELSANLFWSGSFSYNDNYFEKFIMKDWDADWNVIEVDFSGNQIGGFPDILASSKLSWRWKTLLASLQIQHVGRQYLDNTEDKDRIVEAYQLLNFSLSYDLSDLIGFADIAVNLKINNLLDKEYETAGYYDAWAGENYYYPGAGRNVIAGVRMNF